jgi:MerR family transcriptional regulator, redox-sensitive transcriptional activator SoxR
VKRNQALSYFCGEEEDFTGQQSRENSLESCMAHLTISQVAKQAGLRPSAIRYYEQIGILPRAARAGGQRRYDNTVLYRLALVQRSRQMGFTLDEIQRLFFGFRRNTPISERWKKLSRHKLDELDELAEQIKAMQQLLKRITENCSCDALDQCGKRIFQSSCGKDEPVVRAQDKRKNR